MLVIKYSKIMQRIVFLLYLGLRTLEGCTEYPECSYQGLCSTAVCGNAGLQINEQRMKEIEAGLPPKIKRLIIKWYIEELFPDNFLRGKTIGFLEISECHFLTEIGMLDDPAPIVLMSELKITSNEGLQKIWLSTFNSKNGSLGVIEIAGNNELKNVSLRLNYCRNIKQITISSNYALEKVEEIELDPTVLKENIAIELTRNDLVCDCTVKWALDEAWLRSIIDCKSGLRNDTIQGASLKHIDCPEELPRVLEAMVHRQTIFSVLLTFFICNVTFL